MPLPRTCSTPSKPPAGSRRRSSLLNLGRSLRRIRMKTETNLGGALLETLLILMLLIALRLLVMRFA